MDSCIHQEQTPFAQPNKWAHEWHNIFHLMCNNAAEEAIKK